MVTPTCSSPDGPQMMIAGGSRAAARRAATFGLGFISQVDAPGLKSYYESQCREHGRPGRTFDFPPPIPPRQRSSPMTSNGHGTQLGPYLLHDAIAAASYRPGDDSVASITRAESVEALRDARGPYRIFTTDEAVDYMRAGRLLPLHPLCGGVPPNVAWPYLHAAVAAVQRSQPN